jgi:hypothetical protein
VQRLLAGLPFHVLRDTVWLAMHRRYIDPEKLEG